MSVPQTGSAALPLQALPHYVHLLSQTVRSPGPALLNMASVICSLNLALQIFLPALSFNQHKDATTAVTPGENSDSLESERDLLNVAGEAGEHHSIQLIRDEFLMNIQKFANNIQRTMQQLEGEALLFSSSVQRGPSALRRQFKSPGVFWF